MSMAFQFKKNKHRKLAVLTAYDAPTARLLENAGIDIILVGDSLATVILGYSQTRDVSMNEMLHHAKAVRRGAPRAVVVGDMPFKAVNRGAAHAVASARRFMREGRCNAVKIEWGYDTPRLVKAILGARIPVMGHIGLTPQTAQKSGGFRVRGRTSDEALAVYQSAKIFESLGAFSIVLECVPQDLGKKITEDISVPTIGIGAGPDCDGQVLVLQDIIGLAANFKPRFAPQYSDTHEIFKKSIERFVREVRTRRFPKARHSFQMNREDFRSFLSRL